jgi:small subunit ribosomal protein S5
MNQKQEQNLIERVIKISRVSKVTKGGKKLSFRTIIVVGDGKGKVGVGVAKAADLTNSIEKAKTDGIKRLTNIPLTKSFTIPHEVVSRLGACKMIMKPAIEGSGVIAGGSIRIVLEVAGVKNVIAKQLGSDNVLNNALNTIFALNQLTTKNEVLKKRNLNLK